MSSLSTSTSAIANKPKVKDSICDLILYSLKNDFKSWDFSEADDSFTFTKKEIKVLIGRQPLPVWFFGTIITLGILPYLDCLVKVRLNGDKVPLKGYEALKIRMWYIKWYREYKKSLKENKTDSLNEEVYNSLFGE